MFPDITIQNTGPIRGSATLDYSFTNFTKNIELAEVNFPVESEKHHSDHGIVSYKCMLERPANFAWETHEYLHMSDEGIEKFRELIRGQDWTPVKERSDINEKTAEFHNILIPTSKAALNGKRSAENPTAVRISDRPKVEPVCSTLLGHFPSKSNISWRGL